MLYGWYVYRLTFEPFLGWTSCTIVWAWFLWVYHGDQPRFTILGARSWSRFQDLILGFLFCAEVEIALHSGLISIQTHRPGPRECPGLTGLAGDSATNRDCSPSIMGQWGGHISEGGFFPMTSWWGLGLRVFCWFEDVSMLFGL